MKQLILILPALVGCLFVCGQAKDPKRLPGKVYGMSGDGMILKEKQFVIGHNIGKTIESGVHTDFTAFDQQLAKVSAILLRVPALSPPVGFDALLQQESWHLTKTAMYAGSIRVGIFEFMHYVGDNGHIQRAAESSLATWIYINDINQLRGGRESRFFTDTLAYHPHAGNSASGVDNNGHELLILGDNSKPFFTTYSQGEFLQYQQIVFKHLLADKMAVREELQEKMQSAGLSAGQSIDILQKSSHISKDSATRVIAQMLAPYKEGMIPVQQAIDSARDKLDGVIKQYNSMSAAEKKKPAYVSCQLGNEVVGDDELSMNYTVLASPGSGVPLYQYNPQYFDTLHAASIQLLVITYNNRLDETYADDPEETIANAVHKQTEIIQQLDMTAVGILIKNNHLPEK